MPMAVACAGCISLPPDHFRPGEVTEFTAGVARSALAIRRMRR